MIIINTSLCAGVTQENVHEIFKEKRFSLNPLSQRMQCSHLKLMGEWVMGWHIKSVKFGLKLFTWIRISAGLISDVTPLVETPLISL